ncbi:MAG: PH domain-containing protein [Phycisphaeraceae bacterium]
MTLTLLLAVAGGTALVVWDQVALAAAVVLGLALVGAVVFCDALVAYRKERYLFFDQQIVRKSGGILRDNHTELNVANITHVQQVLRWPRYPLFGVGEVVIDSAGSGEHVRLRALVDPQGVYDRVRALMRENGFPLTYARRLHEEQPPAVAVLREVGGELTGVAMLLIFGLPTAGALTGLPGAWGVVVPLALVVLGLGWVGGSLVVRSLDLRRRTYTVYSDAVVYNEGFLTRHNAFLPAENLADSNTRQTMFDRVLGLYDVTLSCQGSGQEIVFRGLRGGPQLSQALDAIASASTPAPVAEAPSRAEAGSDQVADDRPTPAQVASTPREAIAPAAFQMHAPRALVAYGIGAVLAVAIVVLVGVVAWLAGVPLAALAGGNVVIILLMLGAVVRAMRGVVAVFVTRFEFGPHSVKRRYRLLQSHETEYANDKLTGVVYRSNPLDRLFGTCTLEFWSIGAAKALVFNHVRDPGDLLQRALRHAGVHSQQAHYAMPSAWSLRATAGQSLPTIVLTAIGLPALVAAALLVSAWFWAGVCVVALFWLLVLIWEPVYYRRCVALFYDAHLEVRKGVLFRRRYHTLYPNVKHVTTIRYPFVDRGTILFQVAGHAAETRVALGFVAGVAAKHERLDRLLSGRLPVEQADALDQPPAADPTPPVRFARPALANTLVPLVGVSLVLLPLAALLPVTLPWAVMAVRRRSYRIESYRLVACSGVIFARQSSIVFEKIDHIQQAQGLLNKVFGNGNIQVYTAGSDTTDMSVRHIADYQPFYDQLRQQYASGPRRQAEPSVSA